MVPYLGILGARPVRVKDRSRSGLLPELEILQIIDKDIMIDLSTVGARYRKTSIGAPASFWWIDPISHKEVIVDQWIRGYLIKETALFVFAEYVAINLDEIDTDIEPEPGTTIVLLEEVLSKERVSSRANLHTTCLPV